MQDSQQQSQTCVRMGVLGGILGAALFTLPLLTSIVVSFPFGLSTRGQLVFAGVSVVAWAVSAAIGLFIGRRACGVVDETASAYDTADRQPDEAMRAFQRTMGFRALFYSFGAASLAMLLAWCGFITIVTSSTLTP